MAPLKAGVHMATRQNVAAARVITTTLVNITI